MIEVRKLIPQVYNQSRDFSVFMGLLQALINDVDLRSNSLLSLPNESLLPTKLNTYSDLRGYFRFMLKEKGTIESILQAVFLSGGKTVCKLEDEVDRVGNGWDYRSADRYNLDDQVKEKIVYYLNKVETVGHLDLIELNINLIDPGSVDQGLFEKLLYYIKPVNVIIRLRGVTT